ncbi:hypothetical protein TraAM80_06289 [Trypanosoma rangeli]|uniref:Uncharacterized protein n=1 Tax=Trypanosoma rangeli TaxID=5698 RepID=A0A3R7N9A6_TRYRA|nr:uncharacterized protein TraAM80_06289 [Trypanosoma rangeli]RNF02589.1 hypothetical protein TraAM80_06289 [Trypanosoma rangeli]|eukprot:RNF02589.1 hypothetical protein TraAM80_06289 [Trypanosoma rangeli]
MSTLSSVSSRSTYDEETEHLMNPVANASQADESLCQETTEPMTQKLSQAPYAVNRTVTEVTTMGHAVRVPQALRAATRRTMLDVITQLRRQKDKDAASFPGACLTLQPSCNTRTELDNSGILAVTDAAAPSLLSNTTQMVTSKTNTLHSDLSRSLRHLIPSYRAMSGGLEGQHEQAINEDNISDFDDDNEVGERPCQLPQRGSLERLSTAGRLPQRRSYDSTVSEENTRRYTEHHRAWVRLFELDDSQLEEQVGGAEQTTVLPAAKGTPAPRTSTNYSCPSAGVVQSFLTEAEDELRQTTGSRTSLATLLSEAETRDEEACAQSVTVAGCVSNTDERLRRFTDMLPAEEAKDNHMPSRRSLGKPVFFTTIPTNGGGASVSAAFALLQGAAKRVVGRGGINAVLKQLSENPTSARVVAYLAHSFEDWKLDAALIHRADEETEPHDVASVGPSLLESSGVQLKLLVKMVENAFSLYCVRCEVVWADAQTSRELCCDPGAADVIKSVREQQGDEQEGGGVEEVVGHNASTAAAIWTVVLTTAAFRSTPVVVGRHLYLARPFFCYPAICAIVASLNVTSDAAVQKAHSITRRQRRPRDADTLEAHTGGRAQGGGDPCGEEMSVGATTPQRACRSSASLTAVSPFRAYDPFVNPPTNLFRKNTAALGSSTTISQGLLQRSASTPRKTTVNLEGDARGRLVAARSQVVVTSDPIGMHFPRGPGEEWDVPLEILLSLCPPRQRTGSKELGTDGSETNNPSVTPRRICNKESSSLSSPSSIDVAASSRALMSQPEGENRCDRILLND